MIWIKMWWRCLPFLVKVPFYCFGKALFGAITLANPPWVDVHPT